APSASGSVVVPFRIRSATFRIRCAERPKSGCWPPRLDVAAAASTPNRSRGAQRNSDCRPRMEGRLVRHGGEWRDDDSRGANIGALGTNKKMICTVYAATQP